MNSTRRHLGFLFASAAALTLAATPVLASSPSITSVLSSIKVQPTDVPPARSSVEILAARNEFEAFQLVLLGGSQGVTQVQVAKPHLVLDGTGTSLPDSEVRIYREQVIHFSHASSVDGAAGDWPDPIVPDVEDGPALSVVSGAWTEVTSSSEHRNAFPATAAANANVVFWVEVHVPTSAAPGHYSGTLSLTGSSGGSPYSASMPVGLTVRSFALPATSSLSSLFQVSIDNVCNAHGDVQGGYCAGNDQRLWNRLYARFLLDHRISVQLADSPDTSNWSGSASAFDAAYGSLIDGTDVGSRLTGAKLTTVEYPWWNWGSSSASDQTNRMAQFAAHAKAKGWFSRTLDYTGDEPSSASDWTPIITRAGWVHTADPAFRTLVTTPGDLYSSLVGTSAGVVNVMTVVLDNLDGFPGTSYYGNQRDPKVGDVYAPFLAVNGGNEVWGYQSCDQHGCGSSSASNIKNWPNLMADVTAVQNRAEPWMHFIYGETGMLYYDTTYALQTAWNSDGIWAFTGNGDGTLVYPGTPSAVGSNSYGIGGTTHIPIASIRLKMIREGLEDYEYLKLCAAVNAAQAKTIARTLFPMSGTGNNGRETGSMVSAASYPSLQPTSFAQRLESARESLASCITGTSSGGSDGGTAGGGSSDAGSPGGGTHSDAGTTSDGGTHGGGGGTDAGTGSLDAGSSSPDAGGTGATGAAASLEAHPHAGCSVGEGGGLFSLGAVIVALWTRRRPRTHS